VTAALDYSVLDALFERAPVGFAFFDRELRFVRVNEKLAELNGLPIEAHTGRTVAELLPDMDTETIEATFRRVLDTGEPALETEFGGSTPASRDERRFFTNIYPVRGPDGETIGLGCVALEVTARRRAESEREEALHRARFLAEAGVILDQSLDYEATLTAVSRLVVPWLADWCAVDIRDADGTLRRVTTAHVDPEKVEMARDIERRYPSRTERDQGVPNVLATARSEIYPEISDELLATSAQDEEHLELLRAVGIHSVMLVPMIARGRTFGVITFVASSPERRFGDDDLLLAEELARRAATSVDNARLYSERAYIARTLQESLLPPHLPDMPGVELAGLYRPVGEGNEVGGDFYDVFELDDDTWAVVIGDVCGKGAPAAALTALVRYTLRAIAAVEKPPSQILRELNDAILRQRSDGRFCTVAYARVRPGSGDARVDVASGGHPLPVVVRAGGRAELAGEPGTLLGVVPDPKLADVTLGLSAGDALVLYTDGISEAGAPDRLLDVHEVAEMVERCAQGDPQRFAACLEREAVDASGGDPHDDIAIVVLQVPR
jgi:PAS domain S-box-containing protein